jgi:hypothetical protein
MTRNYKQLQRQRGNAVGGALLKQVATITSHVHRITVTDLLKAFLGNGSVNAVDLQQWKMCLGGRVLLCVAVQQRTNEDAG